MKETKQGDGTHLPHGSIGAAINELNAKIAILTLEAGERERRIRELEGAIRDLAGPAVRAGQLVELRK